MLESAEVPNPCTQTLGLNSHALPRTARKPGSPNDPESNQKNTACSVLMLTVFILHISSIFMMAFKVLAKQTVDPTLESTVTEAQGHRMNRSRHYD